MDRKFTFEGYLTYSNSGDADKAYTYVHLYKNGIIEAVNGGIINPEYDGKRFRHKLFENTLIEALDQYSKLFKLLGIKPPIYIYVSLIGVVDYKLEVGNSLFLKIHPIDRDRLDLPAVVIDKLDLSASDVLKPCFDSIWNAFGYSHSYNYDDAGKRIYN